MKSKGFNGTPFCKGDPVEATKLAYEAGLFTRRPTWGVVTGFGHTSGTVRVEIAGRRAISTYHCSYWKPTKNTLQLRLMHPTLKANNEE